MREFRIHVESIVRPLCAGTRRKNRMREELLAHLLAAHQAERDQGASDETARRVAMERLGDSEILRQQLQATVHPLEQKMWAKHSGPLDAYWFERRSSESPWNYTGRWMLCMLGVTAFSMFFPVLFCLGPKFLAHGLNHDTQAALMRIACASGAALFASGLLTFLGALLADRFHLLRVLSPRNIVHPWLMAAGWLAMAGAYSGGSFAIIASIMHFMPVRHDPLWPIFRELLRMPATIPLSFLLLAAVFLFLGEALRRERRQYLDWDSLEVPE